MKIPESLDQLQRRIDECLPVLKIHELKVEKFNKTSKSTKTISGKSHYFESGKHHQTYCYSSLVDLIQRSLSDPIISRQMDYGMINYQESDIVSEFNQSPYVKSPKLFNSCLSFKAHDEKSKQTIEFKVGDFIIEEQSFQYYPNYNRKSTPWLFSVRETEYVYQIKNLTYRQSDVTIHKESATSEDIRNKFKLNINLRKFNILSEKQIQLAIDWDVTYEFNQNAKISKIYVREPAQTGDFHHDSYDYVCESKDQSGNSYIPLDVCFNYSEIQKSNPFIFIKLFIDGFQMASSRPLSLTGILT